MSLRLSIENYVLRAAYGDKKAIDLIADTGFDAMDFSFYWMGEHNNFLEQAYYLDSAREIRQWADKRGLAINQAHAPFDFKLTDGYDQREHDREMIRRSIECAGVMGAEQIIIHNIPTPDPEDFFEVNLEFFRSFEETARESGVKIGVENLVAREENQPMPGRLGTPAELNAFLDQLDPEIFCACIDLGHAQLVTKDPAAFIREIGLPRLQSLHVQDTIYHLDSHNLPYLGRQNWEAIIRALAEVNYQGDFTLEVFLFLKAFPKKALPDALRLAYTTGRSLIRKIELAKECPVTIAEHYGFSDAAQMADFLNDLLHQHQGDYPCPSGDTLHLHYDEDEERFLRDPRFRHYIRFADPTGRLLNPQRLFRLLSAFPYRETLPSIEDIYRWIPDDFDEEEISETLQWMDKIYAFFSSCELTGKASDSVQQITDFFIVDGKLITCFRVQRDGDGISPLLRDFVRIPYEVTEIGPRAFYNCDRPIHVYLPANVKKVAEHAFWLDPDSGPEREHRLLFIEHETGDVEFCGKPFNFEAGYTSVSPLVETSHYFIISPKNSRADQFALDNAIDQSETIDLALLQFLYLTREFELSRDDAGDFIELQEVFRKGEIAAPYVIARSSMPGPIACSCTRISFGISSYIRNDRFPAGDTLKWLLLYGAEEDYFSYEDLNNYDSGIACTAVELMRRKSPNLEKALLTLRPYSIAEYLESLQRNPDYNKGWSNMFFGGQGDEYSLEEFFRLGELCAKLFLTSRSECWESIFEAAKDLNLSLTEEQRFGCFRQEDIEDWSGMKFDPCEEDDE